MRILILCDPSAIDPAAAVELRAAAVLIDPGAVLIGLDNPGDLDLVAQFARRVGLLTAPDPVPFSFPLEGPPPEAEVIAEARRTREHMRRWAAGRDTHPGEPEEPAG